MRKTVECTSACGYRHRVRVGDAAVGLAVLLFTSASLASPNANLEASRLSGPAPLAVLFDATGTTDTDSGVDTFRELAYRFQFDDAAAAGTWTHSGLPKNEQIGGPLAAHVFEKPGIYDVQVTAKNAAGDASSRAVKIEVLSAESVFAGKATVCISLDKDFSGCPAGSQLESNAKRWPTIRSDTRYLLHSGQDFSELGNISAGNVKRVQIGSFGEQEKPIIDSIRLQVGDPEMRRWAGDWIEQVTIMNLDVFDIQHETIGKEMLFYKNRLVRGGMIEFSHAQDYYSSRARFLERWQNSESIFFVENEIDRNFIGDGSSAITGQGRRFVVLGNTFERTPQHNLRIWQTSKAVVAHNYFDGRGRDKQRHCFKVHSAGLDPVILGSYGDAAGIRQISSELVVANNRCGGPASNFQWLFEIGPQSTRWAEGIEKVIVEDNYFEAGPNHVEDIVVRGREIVDRGNWNDTSNTDASTHTNRNNVLPEGWDGPYYFGQPSVRDMFAVKHQAP